MAKKAIKSRVHNRWEPVVPGVAQNSGEVITKPNQTMSIRDILFRNSQGMAYDNYKTPYYEEQASFSSQSLNKIQEMEPVEKLQYLSEISNQVSDLKTKIEADQLAKQEAILEQARKKAQAEIAQQNNKENDSE